MRGSCTLPHGTGKEIKVAFICEEEENNQRALAAGADLVADDEVLAEVKISKIS